MLSDQRLKERREFWDEVLHEFLKKRYAKKSQKCFRYLEKLYFGMPLDPAEESLQELLGRRGHASIFRCMQNQNPEAWEDFFSRIAPAWGLDTFEKLVQHFRPMTYDIFCDPMRFGWSAEEDLAYFRFWWGDRYEPENYHFMGEKRNHPYDAATVCCEVSIGIRMTLSGLRHHTCRYVHLYDYWKNAVLLLDENIFYPKSNYHHDCFRSVDERTKERLRKAKCRVASMLEKINKKEEVIKKFNDDRGKKNGDELSLRPYGMEDLDGDAFWALPELVSLRQQITDDIDNGTLPASIKALNHWASSPASDNTQLNWSTELRVKYKDPWKPAVRKKRKTTSKAKPRPAPKVQIADAELNSICRKLADYRSALIDLGVTVKAEVVQDMTGIDALLKKAKLKGQDATDYLKALSVSNDKLDFYELLIPEYYFEIWREPFDGYEESEVNTVYREIWKQVATATADHCTIEKMRTRKEKIEDGIFNLEVNFVSAGKTFQYYYEVVDTRIDETIYEDFFDFRQAMGLPWRFHIEMTYSESEVFVYYLPEKAKKLVAEGVYGE